ncbi:nucleotide exchange factor GrpE [Prochlorococcus sp. MIT 1223]|uniref:nucleotide exchange factor GrpE n=1 Tax=Prochlorococcus sp. MIT 1223 TaxID=3096217 RepID=UPI002A74D64D|nr:nucleotide exchange factor GrpE [Prochlorococcus sp. MIT 1223]
MSSDVNNHQEDSQNNHSDVEQNTNSNTDLPKDAHNSEESSTSVSPDGPKTEDLENLQNSKSQFSQIADTEARLEQLEKEHETLKKEHETLKSQYIRIAADFDNFRKRQTRDNDDLRIQLTCNTLSEVLPVIDNFERARQQLTPEGEEAQTLHRSYQGLYKQLVEVLKKLGVAPMKVVGQQFDPNLHEAVLREPSEEHSEDIITEELQRGYHLEGRVIRHALVKVSMGPGPSSDVSSKSEESSNLVDNGDDTGESGNLPD